jgi:tetratricopeptide (TPR) repeat protein
MKVSHPCLWFGLSAVLLSAGGPAASAADSPRDYCKDHYDSFKGLIAKNPRDSSAWKELRLCTDELHRWNTVSEVCTGALAKADNIPQAHLMLGLAHFHMKEYTQAIDELDKAIALKSDDPLPYYYTGMSYLFLRQPAQSVKAAQRATELEPNNPSNYSQLAYAYFLLDDKEKCETAAKKAIALNPNEVSAYKVLGNLYAKEGRQEDSDRMFEESIHANGRLAAGGVATSTGAPVAAMPTKPTVYTLPGVPTPVVVAETATSPVAKLAEGGPPAAAVAMPKGAAVAPAPALSTSVAAPPAAAVSPPAAPEPPDAISSCKTQWEAMKAAIIAGDTEKALTYYSDYLDTRDQYRQSFQRLGPARLKTMFGNLGGLYDCEVTFATAACKANVKGSAGQLLVTTVRFERNEDHVWRIRSF